MAAFPTRTNQGGFGDSIRRQVLGRDSGRVDDGKVSAGSGPMMPAVPTDDRESPTGKRENPAKAQNDWCVPNGRPAADSSRLRAGLTIPPFKHSSRCSKTNMGERKGGMHANRCTP